MKALLGILLLGAAAAVFVAGWIQILLPPATYAVLFSKTSGYRPEVIRPGTFSWHWERVIPTNVTLFMFELQPYTATTRSSGELPSAAALATVLPTPAEFRFEVAIVTTLTVRPEALPALMEAQALTPDSLPAWSARMADTVAQAARELLQQQPAAALLDLTALEAEIAAALGSRFPEIELAALRFAEVRLPDLELYERARAAYFALLEAQDAARRAAVAALAYQRESGLAERQAQRDALAALREYGAVFEQYPMLLEFLALPAAANVGGLLDAAVALPAPTGR